MFDRAVLDIPALVRAVGSLAADDAGSDADLVSAITALEELKGAAAAAQARLSVAFDDAQRTAARARGVSRRREGDGVVEQLALARRESPARAAQLLTLARSLAEDLPRTGAALARGEISEFRAQVVARETAHLSPTLREVVDRDLAESEGGIGQWGNRQLAAETQRRAYRLDPEGLVRRRSKAVMDRRVWIRPAPDTMAQVSALLDVKDGVRAYATLRRDAQSRKAAGDARSVDQLMADLLVARLTGDDDGATGSVAVHLVMTDQALLGAEGTPGRQEPADLPGVGVVPAEVARRLVRDADRVWLRRLFVNPTTGGVVAADSRRRVFDGVLREVLVTLDHTCRTPWCDAPVRHVDHVRPVASGGATSFANAQGLCERCNYAKESGGLVSGPSPGRTGEVVVVTRTGHTYRSRRRPPPGAPPLGVASEVEIWLRSRALTWAGPPSGQLAGTSSRTSSTTAEPS